MRAFLQPLRPLVLAVMALLPAVRGSAADEWPAVRDEAFQTVWSTVNEAYFDATFGGVDWVAVGNRYRAQLPGIETNDELRPLLAAMLAELRRSHFAILPREFAVFTRDERKRMGTTGVQVACLGDKLVISAVRPGGAAAPAGVVPGAEVRSVGGLPLEPVFDAVARSGVDASRAELLLGQFVMARLRGPVGSEIELTGVGLAGEPWSARLACEEHTGGWSEPIGDFPSLPLEYEAVRGRDGIAYLRFSVFVPALMKPIRGFLRGLPATAGLVIDLRGNPGGLADMAPAIAGWLVAGERSLGTMRLRKGVINFMSYPQEGAFRGPVAVLIDGSSASTSEVLAAGLRDLGRARLFGQRSAGAALPSSMRRLPTGDLFQFATADIQTPRGESIEGVGVAPDEPVPRKIEDIAAGRDRTREVAEAWLRNRELRAGPGSLENTARAP